MSDFAVTATADDRYFDYCLQPYEPLAPWAGKLRSETFLWHAVELAGLRGSRTEKILRAVRAHTGPDATVYGVKHDDDGRLFFELYFYDPNKTDPNVTATSVIEALRDHVAFAVSVDEHAPYFMWSFELTGKESGSIDDLDLYFSAREVQAGRSYTVRADGGTELANIYRFLHPKIDIDKVVHGIKSSLFIDHKRVALHDVLVPELFSCHRVCVAKKRAADGIYFSGIDVTQLAWFLERYDYPEPIRELVKRERGRLDHLRYDVGIDYRSGPDGQLVSPKTSFYGLL